MPPRVLLVNPPIYDFAAYDFWLKPYGLLRVGGRLRGRAELALFDFLDRLAAPGRQDSDAWGRGHYPRQIVQKPPFLPVLRRRFSRCGLPRACLPLAAYIRPFALGTRRSSKWIWC